MKRLSNLMIRENIEPVSKARSMTDGARTPILLLLLLAHAVFASPDERVEQGKTLATDRSKGNCLACHMIEDGELPGNMGPPLLAMRVRFPDREALGNQICDATMRNSNSRMPPFCRHGILTVEEVELIVDYLYTL
jgi:sulfur-oxidizing protein SoxX